MGRDEMLPVFQALNQPPPAPTPVAAPVGQQQQARQPEPVGARVWAGLHITRCWGWPGTLDSKTWIAVAQTPSASLTFGGLDVQRLQLLTMADKVSRLYPPIEGSLAGCGL